jgi:hypothetical protein
MVPECNKNINKRKRGTPMSSGTPSIEGWQADFWAAMIKAAPRNISEERARYLTHENTEEMREHLAKLCGPLRPSTLPTKTPYLRLISEGQEIWLDKTDGQRTIAQAKDVFAGYRNPDFKSWGLDVKGKKSGKTGCAVYELHKNGRFEQFLTFRD